MKWPLLLLLASPLACVTPPPTPCTETSGCAADQLCVAGECQPRPTSAEACPPVGNNLLRNAGFECGDPPSGWFAQGGELAVETTQPHSGGRAVRLTAKAGTVVNLWYQADAVVTPGTRTFCARAWMRGTARDGRLTIRRVSSSSGGTDETFSSPITSSWTSVPPYNPLKVTSSNDQKLLLKAWIPDARAGDTLVVDDVELWESPDGSCKDR